MPFVDLIKLTHLQARRQVFLRGEGGDPTTRRTKRAPAARASRGKWGHVPDKETKRTSLLPRALSHFSEIIF